MNKKLELIVGSLTLGTGIVLIATGGIEGGGYQTLVESVRQAQTVTDYLWASRSAWWLAGSAFTVFGAYHVGMGISRME